MGEAQLCRRGGNSFRGMRMTAYPAKTEYYPGEYADISGAEIVADFGTFTLPVSDTVFTYAPTGPLTASDTEITVTASVGGRTQDFVVPITMDAVSPVFGDNSWATIARIAALGKAGDYWAVGDTKTENGVEYTIIGMDHDDLSGTDAKYADASYNRNTKRAALTIQIMTPGGMAPMNLTATNAGGWDECHMRNTVLPAYLDGMPLEITDVMRTVDKVTASRGSRTSSDPPPLTTSADRLFLLADSEEFNQSGCSPEEKAACRHYAYYTDDYSNFRGVQEWMRSPAWGTNNDDWDKDFAWIWPQSLMRKNGIQPADRSLYYFPAFCI